MLEVFRLGRVSVMETLDVFRSSVLYSHEELAQRLEQAREMPHSAEEPRKGFEDLDTFLAVASIVVCQTYFFSRRKWIRWRS